jgi:hypothetical protein
MSIPWSFREDRVFPSSVLHLFVLCHLSVHISPCAIIIFLETISHKPNIIPATPTAIATLAPSCTTTPAPVDDVGAALVMAAVTVPCTALPLLGGPIVLPPPVTVVSGVGMAYDVEPELIVESTLVEEVVN